MCWNIKLVLNEALSGGKFLHDSAVLGGFAHFIVSSSYNGGISWHNRGRYV